MLAPDLSRTLLALGDVHHYDVAATGANAKPGANARAAQVQARAKRLGDPAGLIQIGDLVEVGLDTEHAIAKPWWDAWTMPKVICTGNHDIDISRGGDTVVEWEARYGDRTQVLDTEYFRVVSCLWSAQADGGNLARALNTNDGHAELDTLIGATDKPTALAFHYALRGSVPTTELPAGNFAISPFAQDTVLTGLIADHANLQLVLTGHTHSIPLACMNWGVTGKPTGSNGRRIHHHNLSALTYVSNLGTVRSPLHGFYFTFYDGYFETRIRNFESEVWSPRWLDQPKVEKWDYS